MSFVHRIIRLTFRLGEGTFGEDGSNQVVVGGLRVRAKVEKAGGASMGKLNAQIYGLTFSLMNRLSTLGMAPNRIRRNTVLLEAGDADKGVSAVFDGTISNAWADFAGMPNVVFNIDAQAGLFEAVKPLAPSSFPGTADAAIIMAGLAEQEGLAFENSGVSVLLSNPYFYGSPRNQMKACADAAGIEWVIDNRTLAIWPKLASRGGLIPLVSSATGMIGYPTFTSRGIFVRSLFNRDITFGGRIKVQSALPQANQEWIVYKLDYDLESEVPGGQWVTNAQCAPPGFAPVVEGVAR